MVTFTYPDSMASFAIGNQGEHIGIRKKYHGLVFTLNEIKEVVSEFGMPDRQSSTYDRFIEVQVWDDRPIQSHSRLLIGDVTHYEKSAGTTASRSRRSASP